MKKISVLDTSIANYNLGNEIIMDSVYDYVYSLFYNDFIYKISCMDITTNSLSYLKSSDILIWGGTNSLCGEMEKYTQWGINSRNVKDINRKVVMMGLGWWQYQENISRYTKKILNNALNRDFLSSVRDQYTANKLISVGFENIINTGCPTIWNLTKEHCADIPDRINSEVAIVTFTDYNKNKDRDIKLFEIIKKNYKYIMFWPQGAGDYLYIKKILDVQDKQFIPPHLKNFDSFLSKRKPDYIGTRLHGGIRALQKKCRAIIISIDNRATEMGKDFSLPVVDISQLEKNVSCTFPEISIPYENILKWKEQFQYVSQFSPIERKKKTGDFVLNKIIERLGEVKHVFCKKSKF